MPVCSQRCRSPVLRAVRLLGGWEWRAIRDEYRNFLLTQECAKMAQAVADLAQ